MSMITDNIVDNAKQNLTFVSGCITSQGERRYNRNTDA